MLTQDLKDFIQSQCGDPALGIGDVSDLSAEQIRDIQQMNRTMASYSPMFDAETPVVQPVEFLDNARSMIALGSNGFFGRRPLPGNPPRGEIMNFFVNQDCIVYTAGISEKITSFLAEQGFQAIAVANGIPLKIASARCGLGRYGKNGVIQAPGKGSWLGLNVIITDAPLEADDPLQDPCGDCCKCQEACPTRALDTPYRCDIKKCITLHALYNKGNIPVEVQDRMGTCIAHCNACLDACPKNSRLSVQTEVSMPEDLVFPEIAPLVNLTENDYQQKFGGSFLEFVMLDKKYFQRNAAIALGNYGDPAYAPVLYEALETQEEEIVRQSAARSLGKLNATQNLEKYLSDPSDVVREAVREALNT